MKGLVIDFSTTNEIRAILVKSGPPATVLAAWHFESSEPGEGLASLANELRAANLLRLPAYVVPPRNLLMTQLISLPKMPEREAKKVVRRELHLADKESEEIVFTFTNNRSLQEKDIEKKELLTFAAGRHDLYSFLDQLQEHGLHPLAIIPEQFVLQSFIDQLPEITPSTCLIWIEMQQSRISINLFAQRAWALQRDFAFRLQDNGELQDEDLERIGLELNRTIQFFKQKNRGFSKNLAVISGGDGALAAAENYINETLGIDSLALQDGLLSRKVLISTSLDLPDSFRAAFQNTLIAALQVGQKKIATANLIPGDFRERGKTPARLAGLVVSSGIIFVILALATFQLQRSLAGQKNNSLVAKNSLETAQRLQSGMQSAKAERAAFLKTRFLVDYPGRSAYSSAEFVRRLSLLADARTRLLDLVITPSYHYCDFNLKGVITAADSLSANRVYLEFIQALKTIPGVHDLSAVEARIDFRLEQDYASAALSRENDRSVPPRLHFSIKGKIENQ